MEENSSSSRECAPEAPSEEHSSDIPEEIQDERSDSLEDEDASVADDHAIVKVPTNSTNSKPAKPPKKGSESQEAMVKVSRPTTRTSTRKVQPPDRLMMITLGMSLSETPGYVTTLQRGNHLE